MQPQKAEVQSFFDFLSGLQHLVAGWQRHAQAGRAALHARHRNSGIALRAIGTTKTPKNRAPLRLAGPEESDHRDVQSDLRTAEELAREQTNIREISESQKAVTERLRDRYWLW